MRLIQIARRLREHRARYGALATVSIAFRSLLPEPTKPSTFDQQHGTDTGGSIPLWKVRVASAHAETGARYVSTSEDHIRVLLDPLPRTSTVVDLGCGKGRVLCVAAMMGFPVIGIEFVEEWVLIARRNLAHLGLHGEVLHADAAAYLFPSVPLAVYLYDPFGPSVMRPVVAALRQHPADLRVLYVNPRCADLFSPWMTRLPLTTRQAALFSPESVGVYDRPASPSC